MFPISFTLRAFEDLSVRELYRLLHLRVEVFIVEQDCPYQDLDGLDEVAFHLQGHDEEGELVVCARLLPVGIAYPEHAAIGRVITARSVRGRGVGAVLMKEAIRQARGLWGEAVPIRIGAQDYAIPFYRKLGFEPAGEGYLEDGIPHTPMNLVG
jgi:ElaA protein